MPSLDFDFDADDEEEGLVFEDEDVPGLLLDEGRPLFEVEVDGLFLLVLPPSRRLLDGTGAFFLFLKTSKSKYSICTGGLLLFHRLCGSGCIRSLPVLPP